MSATTHLKATAHYDGMPFKVWKPLKDFPIKEHTEVHRNAKVKFLPDGMCKVTCFSRPVYRVEGYKLCEAWDRANVLQHADDLPPVRTPIDEERKRADSLKRAKDKIFEIAACNDWSYMVTFTLDKEKVNRYNADEIIKPFGKWLDNMVQRRGLRALIVPEHHKDGAIHFHGLVNDSLKMVHSGNYKIKGEKKTVKLSTLRKRGKKPNDSDVQDVFNVTDYKLGHSTAVMLDGNTTAVSFYMTKYATKELDKIFGSYYFAVGKIKRELPYVICNMDFEKLKSVGKVVSLPDGLGDVVYSMITKDDFEGSEIHGL